MSRGVADRQSTAGTAATALRRAVTAITAITLITLGATPARAEDRTFGLALHVAEPNGEPVRDDAWIDAQIASAEALFGALQPGVGVHFRWTERRRGPIAQEALETREDRDALGDAIVEAPGEPRLIHVFLVASLRDVDEPPGVNGLRMRMRMGVCWTHRVTRRRYIALSAIAKPSVLAHELGHFFGNPHTTEQDNLMSYSRGSGAVFLSEAQKERIAAYAERFARGSLTLLGPPRFLR